MPRVVLIVLLVGPEGQQRALMHPSPFIWRMGQLNEGLRSSHLASVCFAAIGGER